MRLFTRFKSAPVKSMKLFAGLAASVAVGTAPIASAQMMMLPGQYGVTPSGAATYTIPIEVPPGTAGMTPSLTLNYSSQQGNGLLGVGWSLGGLPSIGRCGKTIAQDGVTRGVRFDGQDKFCLDGQKLIAVSGSYGGNGTEYRTEIDGFSKIVSYTESGITGPAKFKVWTKSGQVMEFGYTSNARMVASAQQDVVRSWAVNRITDVKGNYLAVAYHNNVATGEAYPTRIVYTGNDNANLNPTKYVDLDYEDRSDDRVRYLDGSKITTTKRLKAVRTYFDGVFNPTFGPLNGTLSREYNLTYQESAATKRSVLKDIELCAGTGNDQTCLPKTEFDVTTSSFGFASGLVNKLPTNILKATAEYQLFPADWNGDGVTDVLAWKKDTGANIWYIGNGSGDFTNVPNPIATSKLVGGNGELLFGDFDGDGLPDFFWRERSNGQNYYFINNSSGTTVAFNSYSNKVDPADVVWGDFESGDWNGDALTDFVWFDSDTGANKLFVLDQSFNVSTSNNPVDPSELDEIEAYYPCSTQLLCLGTFRTRLRVADWNGDGVTDILWDREKPTGTTGTNGLTSVWGFGNGDLTFELVNSSVPIITHFGASAFKALRQLMQDWNGDGLADLVRLDKDDGESTLLVHQGLGSFAEDSNLIPVSVVQGDDNVFYVGDWNADGLDDILRYDFGTGSTSWQMNEGDASFSPKVSSIPSSDLDEVGSFYPGDFFGDGLTDMLWVGAQHGTNRLYLNTSTVPDLLETVTTGLGSETTFVYKSGTDASVYTKDSGASAATYPDVDFIGAMQLVSQVDSDNGVGGTYSSTYEYLGGKYHAKGRGFLGFRQYKVRDEQICQTTNASICVEQTQTFRQDFPFIGALKEDKKVLGSVVLNETTNTYDDKSWGPQYSRRYFPFLKKSIERANDPGGNLNDPNNDLPTVTTEYFGDINSTPSDYDDFGNPLIVVVKTGTDADPDAGGTKTTINEYLNETSGGKWQIGRLTNTKVTSQVPEPDHLTLMNAATGAGAGAAGSGGDPEQQIPDPTPPAEIFGEVVVVSNVVGTELHAELEGTYDAPPVVIALQQDAPNTPQGNPMVNSVVSSRVEFDAGSNKYRVYVKQVPARNVGGGSSSALIARDIAVMVMKPGTHILPSGETVMAGLHPATLVCERAAGGAADPLCYGNNFSASTISFDDGAGGSAFSTSPILLTHVQEADEYTVPRVLSVTAVGAEVGFQYDELKTNSLFPSGTNTVTGPDGTRTVGWVALLAGEADGDNGLSLLAGKLAAADHTDHTQSYPSSFVATSGGNVPLVLASMTTATGIDPSEARLNGLTTSGFVAHVLEEQSENAELTHWSDESIDWVAFTGEGTFTGGNSGGGDPDPDPNPPNPSSNADAVGEVVLVQSVDGSFKTHSLSGVYDTTPVIIAMPQDVHSPSAQPNPIENSYIHAQVQQATDGTYEVSVRQIPSNYDNAGVQTPTTITPRDVAILVMKPGSWILDGGLTVEAGLVTTSGACVVDSNCFDAAHTTVPLSANFNAVDPAVLAHPQNATVFTVPRVQNRTATGFDVAFQYDEHNVPSGSPAGQEVIGWVAIEKGTNNSVGNADGAPITVTSKTPGSITQNEASVWVTGFSSSNLVFANFATGGGQDVGHVRIRKNATASFMAHILEEQSQDTELTHFFKRISYSVFSGEAVFEEQ